MIKELLAPAGDLEAGYAAIFYGANAVYLGLQKFSARATATNFTEAQLDEFVAFAHAKNVKVYVALNTLVQENECNDLIENSETLSKSPSGKLILAWAYGSKDEIPFKQAWYEEIQYRPVKVLSYIAIQKNFTKEFLLEVCRFLDTHPEIIREAVAEIRAQTQAPIYLYTARTQGLDELMPILDGVTLTLHEPGDCLPFWRFDQSTQSLDGKSLRLNIFEEVGPVASSERWQVKDHMAWIPNCPLPQGEVLMRFRPYGG